MKINKQNYRNFLLDYLDNELSEEESMLFQDFMEKHNEIKREFLSLQKIKLPVSEEVIFPNKNTLYRSKRSNSGHKWWLWTAAAVFAGLLFFTQYNWHIFTQDNTEVSLAKNTQPHPSLKGNHKDKAQKESISSSNHAPRVATTAPHTNSPVKEEKKQASTVKHPLAINRKEGGTSAKVRAQKGTIKPIKTVISYKSVEKKSFYPELTSASLAVNEHIISKDSPKTSSKKRTSQLVKKNKWEINITKEEDTTLTDRIYALQDKITHPIKTLNIKQVKIGNISLQFN